MAFRWEKAGLERTFGGLGRGSGERRDQASGSRVDDAKMETAAPRSTRVRLHEGLHAAQKKTHRWKLFEKFQSKTK